MPMPEGALLQRSIQPDVLRDALAGLTRPRKTLPAKLFYDAEGCRLFGAITELPEYYLTRTERGLLLGVAPELARRIPAGSALVEYGASSEEKAAILLGALRAARRPARAYVPIDVAAEALDELAARMEASHPDLPVLPLAADFMTPLALPEGLAGLPRLGFFPGSTIGNLEPAAARQFLEQARRTLAEGGADGRGVSSALFLVGVDLRKDAATLVSAYDDAAGVTAAFNRNVLARLNRDAGADFDPDGFDHRAVWNEEEGRIEMHLVSRTAQAARLGDRTIRFRAGETIHTENSYKHTAAGFRALAEKAGWSPAAFWTDPHALFSLHLLEARA
jgi:dimethylhistidine N-methyltransferase